MIKFSNIISLSIITTVFNEEDSLSLFIDAVIPLLDGLDISYEIIMVNDGSVDATYKLLNSYQEKYDQIKTIHLSRNFGKDVALTAGLDFSSGRAVIPIDVDFQDPIEVIPEMIAKWEQGNDIVLAERKSRAGDGFFKRILSNSFYRIFNSIADRPIPRNVGDFRLMDRKVVEQLKQFPERVRFMKGLFSWVGFDSVTIYFERQGRKRGKTKWGVGKLWNYSLDGIISFSSLPLKIWGYIGFMIFCFAMCYALFLMVRTLIFGIDVPGYASIMVTVLFLGGMNLLGIGILGEYLSRMFYETKQRPIYIVKESSGFNNN